MTLSAANPYRVSGISKATVNTVEIASTAALPTSGGDSAAVTPSKAESKWIYCIMYIEFKIIKRENII